MNDLTYLLLFLLILSVLQGCDTDPKISLSHQVIEDHLELINDVQIVLDHKKKEVKGNFVSQYLSTREHVTHSVDNIFLPDTSDFGRKPYNDLKNLALEGTRLLDALNELSETLSNQEYHTIYQPGEEDLSLFAEIETFGEDYLSTATINASNEKTINIFIENLRETAITLLYLERIQALKVDLLESIKTVQLQNQSTTLRDYFTQLSPFLFIPESEQVYVSKNSEQAHYSGRIYAINRYDFNQGLFIKSISINGSDIGYNPDSPSYHFSIPVEPNAGDSLDFELKALAITHEGADTTFVVKRKFQVVKCP